MTSPTDLPSPTSNLSTDGPLPDMTTSTGVPSRTLVPPTDIPSPNFGILEVDQRASYIHPPVQGPMASKPEDEGLPQVVQSHVPEHHKSENDTSVSHGDANSKKFAGFSIRAIGFMIVGAMLVTLGAVLGGVFGNRKSHHDFKTPSVEPSGGDTAPSSDPSPTDTRNVNILPNSNITATVVSRRLKLDEDVTTYHLIAFQDIGGSMIACALSSAQKTWTTQNLTAATENASPINAMYGSPLASAALYWGNDTFIEHNVWYLHPDGTTNNVYWYIDVDHIPVSTRGVISSLGKNPRTTLAVSRRPIIDYSEKGFDLVYLLQQYGENQIMIITMKYHSEDIIYEYYTLEMQYPSHLDIWSPDQQINSTAEYLVIGFESNGRLVNTDFYPAAGIGESTMMSVQRLHNTRLTDSAMFKDSAYIRSLSDFRADPRDIKQLLTIPYIDDTMHRNIYLILLSNGTFVGSKVGPAMRPVIISGGPTANFTAIATTDDSRLYGISGDEVLEYVLNIDDNISVNFTFVGKVYP